MENNFAQGYQAALDDVINAGMGGELLEWIIDNTTNNETLVKALHLQTISRPA